MASQKKQKQPRFVGWVRTWGNKWKRECSGHTLEMVQIEMQKEFGRQARVSTLVLADGESPYVREEHESDASGA